MKRSTSLILALTLCVLLARYAKAEVSDDPNNNDEKALTIELNKLDVNDTALELSYNIKNNTDHDVWICDNINNFTQGGFEVFLAEDAQTLVMRRRLDVPSSKIWRRPTGGTYIRLRPGEVRAESLSLNLPVTSSFVFSSQSETQVTQNARSLAIEIGFYDEDLPGLVYSILKEAEKFPGFDVDSSFDIKKIYFRGVMIRGSIGSLSYFEEFIKNPYGADGVYIGYTGQDFTGEKVLRIVVDGVSIPYEGYVQLASNADSSDDPNNNEEKIVTAEIIKFDVNDTALELSYNIKNNTDHDVWICDSVNTNSSFNFEVYLAEDAQTLVIRRRLDVPTRAVFRRGPPYGRYICLRPGDDRPESLSLNLPVQQTVIYSSRGRTQVTQNARSLAIEIGFYDENLPWLVYSILRVAENFNSIGFEADFSIAKDYYRGLLVRSSIGGLSYYEKVVNDPYGEGEVLIDYSYQALTGEKVLRIIVDGVSIPYEGYVQSAD